MSFDGPGLYFSWHENLSFLLHCSINLNYSIYWIYCQSFNKSICSAQWAQAKLAGL